LGSNTFVWPAFSGFSCSVGSFGRSRTRAVALYDGVRRLETMAATSPTAMTASTMNHL
jgi:hypothetical protein